MYIMSQASVCLSNTWRRGNKTHFYSDIKLTACVLTCLSLFRFIDLCHTYEIYQIPHPQRSITCSFFLYRSSYFQELSHYGSSEGTFGVLSLARVLLHRETTATDTHRPVHLIQIIHSNYLRHSHHPPFKPGGCVVMETPVWLFQASHCCDIIIQ